MITEVTYRCQCGSVRGLAREVGPSTCLRSVCYCDDCQAFAHFLGRADVLDARGGTEIVAMAPARLRIEQGHEQIRSMRLKDGGMIRFYSACCRTPLGNTVSAGMPFVGLPIGALSEGLAERGGVDAVLGPIVGRVLGTFARPGPGPELHPKTPLSMILKVVKLFASWTLRRLGRPTPFYDARTKKPVAEPEVLTPAARAALDRA